MALIGNVKGPPGIKGDTGEKGDPLSIPPEGCFKVINIYVNPITNKLVIEYDDKGE